MKIEIHIFAEGQTERKVIDEFRSRAFFPNYSLNVVECGGKININRQLQQKLRFSLNVQPVRALILRDLDDGETHERIVQSVRDGLIQVFRESNVNEVPHFAPLQLHRNIYAWKSVSLNFHIAVHIADYRWNTSFTKRTIDDLVLQLAFNQDVVDHLAQRQKVNVNGQIIIQKVTQEIPTLLQQNGFPPLSEAKDYVRLYAAVIRMHTSPPVFAEKVLASTDDHLVQQNFASIIAAIEALQ